MLLQPSIMLQTVSVNHLGRSESSFRLGLSGQSLEIIGFDKGLSLSHRTHPIRVFSPHWLPFCLQPYSYLPFKRLVVPDDVNAFFDPPVVFTKQNILTLKSVNVTLCNEDPSQPLVVHDISSISPWIFAPVVTHCVIQPNDTAIFTFFVCPTLSGFYSSTAFFQTNKGDLPLSMFIDAGLSTKEHGIPPQLHLCSIHPANLTMKIPYVIHHAPHRFSALFDANLFEGGIQPGNERFLQLRPLGLQQEYYLTFVSLVIHGNTRSIPQHIFVSPYVLQPVCIVLTVEVVTAPSETREADIVLVNPSSVSLEVVDLSLPLDAPSNIKVQLLQPPVVCVRTSHTVVGRVTVKGTIPGPISTIITANYVTPSGITGATEIPVRANVVYGSLHPSVPRINFIQSMSYYDFSFINEFDVPIFVFSAYIPSHYFKVVNFRPFTLLPGRKSPEIHVSKEGILPEASDANLTIETNLTSLVVPILCYSGLVSVSKTQDAVGSSSSVSFHCGPVLCGTVSNFTVFISNPNPSPFVVKSSIITQGIELGAFWMRRFGESLMSFTVPPFETRELNLFIAFNFASLSRSRNDSLSLISDDVHITIDFNWIPLLGQFTVSTNLPSVVSIGSLQTGDILIQSTFTRSIKLRRVSSFTSCVDIHSLSPFIRQNQEAVAGTYSIRFDRQFFVGTRLDNLLSQQPGLYRRSEWIAQWEQNNVIRVDLNFAFKNGFQMHRLVSVVVESIIFDDIIVILDRLTMNMQNVRVFDLYNNQPFPIEFSFSNEKCPEIILPSTFVVGPYATGQIPFIVESKKQGITMFKVLASSNATSPFKVKISGDFYSPVISLVDIMGSVVSLIEFNDSTASDFSAKPLRRTFFLRNDGETEIQVDYVTIGSFPSGTHPFTEVSVSTEETIPPHMAIEVVFKIYLTKLPREFFAENVTFVCCGKEFVYNWIFEISAETKRQLRRIRLWPLLSIITTNILLPILLSLLYLRDKRRLAAAMKRKQDLWEKMVPTLSVTAHLPTATQVFWEREDQSGGRFIASENNHHEISKGTLFAMSLLLDSIGDI